MKLLIDIPKEFVAHFEQDKFADSLERVRSDIHKSLTISDISLAGNYELELIEMLIEAFKNCKRVNTTTISNAPLMEMELLEKAKEIIKDLLSLCEGETDSRLVFTRAEQFLKEVEIQEDRLCEHCDQYKSCPDGKRCRTCDNGSKWKRR